MLPIVLFLREFPYASPSSRENQKLGIQVQYFNLIPFPVSLNVVPGYNTQMSTCEAGLKKTGYTQQITSWSLAHWIITCWFGLFYFSFLWNLKFCLLVPGSWELGGSHISVASDRPVLFWKVFPDFLPYQLHQQEKSREIPFSVYNFFHHLPFPCVPLSFSIWLQIHCLQLPRI